MTPEGTLKLMQHQLNTLKEIQSKHVAVGVLKSKSTGKVYKNGTNVLTVAAAHEYGDPIQRSFLRMPQELKAKELSAFINKQMINVLGGQQVEKGLGLIGVYAVNLSQEAFETGGFGKWPDISGETKDRKGSSAILIDKGILKNSVTWEIRR